MLQNLTGSFRDPPRKQMSVSGGRGLFEPGLLVITVLLPDVADNK